MPTLTLIVSHDQKCHVSSQFSHLGPTNAVVALMMPLASHDVNADTNGVTQPQKSCCISFQPSLPKVYIYRHIDRQKDGVKHSSLGL